MAAKKMNAVFLMCIVVVAVMVQFSSATAAEESESKVEAKFTTRFKSCYATCEKECLEKGNGASFCEVKCDEDCDEKEVADKLHIEPAN